VRWLPRHLAPRLILLLTVFVVIVEGAFGYLNISIQERQLIEEVITGADQLSRSITSATWHAMLADHRQDAYDVMDTIAKKQSIERIRIFNKEGRVMFSTVPGVEAEENVQMDSETCQVCHSEPDPRVEVDTPSRARIFHGEDGRRMLGMVTAFYNEPSCVAACHAHPPETSVLGVLDLTMDLQHVDDELTDLTLRAALMSLTHIVFLSLVIYLFTRHFVAKPIRKLLDGTKAVGAMDLDQTIDVRGTTELDELTHSFNAMREDVRRARTELEDLAQSLEEKVGRRSRQLEATRQKLIQSDRLASLGKLAATVAHEVNNPVGSVLNLSMIMQRILTDEGVPEGRVGEFRGYLSQVSSETARVGRIVSDLLSFSRGSAPASAEVDLNESIRHTLSLISHKLELSRVATRMELAPELPAVQCDASKIEQVVLNLVMNASEAMPKGGEVVVRTSFDPSRNDVLLQVEDTGTGISAEVMPRIFDPFFSTKEEGAGVGLGLAVVYGIVDAHKGTLDVTSNVNVGTTFTVRLPVAGPNAEREP
jgi:two-component system NtrC family sensor kinase